MALKGVIFTVMATIITVILIWGGYNFMSESSVGDWQSQIMKVKIDNNFISSFKDYSSDALRISVINGLNDISDIYYYYDDPDMMTYFGNKELFISNLSSCIINNPPLNTVSLGDKSFICESNITLPYLFNLFTNITYDNLDINITYSIYNHSLNISQINAFSLNASIRMNISLIDKFSNWSLSNITIVSRVPIIGIKDPVIAKFRGNNTYVRRDFPVITIKSVSPLYKWDVNTTLDFMNDKEYRRSTKAPSFLMRYYGNFSPNEYGIETLINSSWLVPLHFNPLENRSFIDYDLFHSISDSEFQPELFNCSGDTHASRRVNADNYPVGFRLSKDQLIFYNISFYYWESCS